MKWHFISSTHIKHSSRLLATLNMNNFTILFRDNNKHHFGNLRCTLYREAGMVNLSKSNSHLLVFVLDGSLEVSEIFIGRLAAHHLMAINVQKIRSCTCTAGTIILEFIPPPRLTYYLNHCSNAFNASFSTPRPILPELGEWISGELAKTWSEEPTQEELCIQRKSFARIMNRYPPHLLNELYVCFYACASGDCGKCNKEIDSSIYRDKV